MELYEHNREDKGDENVEFGVNMLNGNQKVNAIAWEAKRQGVSYGMFSAMLTEGRKQQIYKAYERYPEEKQAAEKRRKSTGPAKPDKTASG